MSFSQSGLRYFVSQFFRMSIQLTSHVLMIRPVRFGYNEETAMSNHYQHSNDELNPSQIQKLALDEFDGLVNKLRLSGISVTVVEDTLKPHTPDSIFPNNWVSFHANGRTVLYPMFAKNRRAERRGDILTSLDRDCSQVYDMDNYKSEHRFLEGTGSMVLDRKNKIAYACYSDRTNRELLNSWANEMKYSICGFHATQVIDGSEKPIYHTNVMMSVGEKLAIVCLDVVKNDEERDQLIKSLESNNRKILEITENQIYCFAGNILQLKNTHGENLWVMSTQAFASFTELQTVAIQKHSTIIHSQLKTIEKLGGGSARCMIAEVFV